MDDILLKYKSLPPDIQEEVKDFLDFMIAKYSSPKSFDLRRWKNKIQEVSIWTDEEVDALEDNIQQFGKWKLEEW